MEGFGADDLRVYRIVCCVMYLLRLLRLLHLDELFGQAADLNKFEGLLAADAEDDAAISLLI